MDLAALGFDGGVRETTGRPAYHPATLLKIYLYGYLNRIPSSRRPERETQWARINQEPQVARKPFILSDATREKVRYLAGVGVPQDDIARIVGCAPKTLRKRCRGARSWPGRSQCADVRLSVRGCQSRQYRGDHLLDKDAAISNDMWGTTELGIEGQGLVP